ncbi:MAG: TauD/TfdA family dioxygenase [Proteobacteria bacterium]|nr:TauD/TfdA family dioxygenase [Pseudomonadota bacterium]
MLLPPLQPDFAAEVTGTDLAQPLTPENLAALKEITARHGVIVFRDQKNLSYDGMRRFARLFGQTSDCASITNLDAQGNIRDRDDRDSRHARGDTVWHMDMLTLEAPHLMGFLKAKELPASGGETEFADVTQAWQRLPETLRDKITGLRAMHSLDAARRRAGLTDPADIANQYKPTSHPLVTIEPFSNRPALLFGAHTSHIEGMDTAESGQLLEQLLALATTGALVYKHRWRLNDLLVWNNRRVMHRVRPYDLVKERRFLWRMVVEGERPPAYLRKSA